MSKYQVGQRVILAAIPGYDPGPWEIIEVVPEYPGFKSLDDPTGYRMRLWPPGGSDIVVVAHDDTIDHIYQPKQDGIIRSARPTASEEVRKTLNDAFEEVLAARQLLVEATNRFKSLLEKMEEGEDA